MLRIVRGLADIGQCGAFGGRLITPNIADVRQASAKPPQLTLFARSAFAQGTALPAPQPTFDRTI